jgi:hypothetical protein
LSKSYNFGFNFFAAYTYGDAKDITNGIRNSMESNWQMNQSLTPNDPKLTTSNFAIKNRIVANLGYAFNISESNRLSPMFISMHSLEILSLGDLLTVPLPIRDKQQV